MLRIRKNEANLASVLPEPKVLTILGEESRRNGTDKLTTREIDQVIKAARREKAARG